MKLLSTEETLERLKGELDRVQEEANLKYGTKSVKKLKNTSGHGPQQAQDRKALAFQMETYINAIEQIDAISVIKSAVNREVTLRSWPNQ